MELSAIGNSVEGPIYCVLTGTSTYLRQLCFKKLHDTMKSDFPAYQNAPNLNAMKYAPYTLLPMQTEKDVDGVRSKLRKVFNSLLGCTTESLFVKTAGVPGSYRKGHVPSSL